MGAVGEEAMSDRPIYSLYPHLDSVQPTVQMQSGGTFWSGETLIPGVVMGLLLIPVWDLMAGAFQ